jgi:hypothetical protein
MLVAQADQDAVADGIAREARPLRRSRGGQQQGEENDRSYHRDFHLFRNSARRAPILWSPWRTRRFKGSAPLKPRLDREPSLRKSRTVDPAECPEPPGVPAGNAYRSHAA